MRQYELLIDRLEEMAADDKVRVCDKRTLGQAADALAALQEIVTKQAVFEDKLLNDLLLMEAQLRKVEKVRDAALEDLMLTGKVTCILCAHDDTQPNCDVECGECREACACKECKEGSKFLWRGILGQG